MKTMRLTKKSTRNALLAALMTASLILALSVGGVVSDAQSGFEGDYDTSFATNGYHVDPESPDPTVGGEQTYLFTGELLPDGSIIAGGRIVTPGPTGDFYLRKFNAAGAVVTSFGTNGFVRANFHSRYDGHPGNDLPEVLKVQPDGKILFAGKCDVLEPGPFPALAFGTDACVMRFNPDGTPDSTFGGAMISYTSQSNQTHTTQLGPGRVIIMSGAIGDGKSFGTNGTVHDMAVQPDGKIVVVGETFNYSSFHGQQVNVAFIARLNPNGSLDSTFGSNGIARWVAPQTAIEGCYPARRFFGVRLQPDGRVIAVGHGEITRAEEPCAYGQRFAVTRWTAAGQLETVKYIDSLANVDVHFTERAVAAHLSADGSKLYVSGSARNRSGIPAGRQKPTLVRMHLSTLALDTTFGSGGIAQYDVAFDNNAASTLYLRAIQPDGKFLGVDNAGLPGNYVRLNADGSGDESFGNESIDSHAGGLGRLRVFVTHFNGVTSQIEAGHILLRPNGRINLVAHSSPHAGQGLMRAVVSQQNTELPTYTLAGRVLNGSGVGVAGVTVNLSGSQSAGKVTDASGNYSFADLPMGGSFTVTPAKAGLSFVPASKSFANLSADQLSVNFAVPSLSVNNITVTEANTGETTATFTVKLTPAATVPVTVKYATANSTALAPGDYTALALTQLSFAPGETTKAVAVKIKGDTLDEANETFRLLLSAPAGALVSDNEGVCTITDNDLPPALRVNSLTVTEGNSATTATFTVSLSAQSAQTVTVKYATVNGTAAAPSDYTAKALTTLTFAPFQTTKTVPVTVAGDLRDEPAETFKLQLSSPTNATIAAGAGTCTINDNDPPPAITISNATATEPDSGARALVFTVKLSAPSGQTVTVKYATANGTTNPATAGTDYTAIALTTLTFLPGQTSKTVAVQAKGDLVKEANETFFVNLSAPTNATVADAQGLGTILNDD